MAPAMSPGRDVPASSPAAAANEWCCAWTENERYAGFFAWNIVSGESVWELPPGATFRWVELRKETDGSSVYVNSRTKEVVKGFPAGIPEPPPGPIRFDSFSAPSRAGSGNPLIPLSMHTGPPSAASSIETGPHVALPPQPAGQPVPASPPASPPPSSSPDVPPDEPWDRGFKERYNPRYVAPGDANFGHYDARAGRLKPPIPVGVKESLLHDKNEDPLVQWCLEQAIPMEVWETLREYMERRRVEKEKRAKHKHKVVGRIRKTIINSRTEQHKTTRTENGLLTALSLEHSWINEDASLEKPAVRKKLVQKFDHQPVDWQTLQDVWKAAIKEEETTVTPPVEKRSVVTASDAVQLPGTHSKRRTSRTPGVGGVDGMIRRVNECFQESLKYYQKRSEDPLFTDNIILDEVQSLMGVLWKSTSSMPAEFKDLWATDTVCGTTHHYAINAFTRDRAQLLYRCLRCTEAEVERIQDLLNRAVGDAWEFGNIFTVDESMNPYKGRNNPHHVFIPRKPHPNGTKSWVIADLSGCLCRVAMFKRSSEDAEGKRSAVDPEQADATLDRMKAGIVRLGDAVTADGYFSGIKPAARMALGGGHFSLSSRADRPKELFQHLEPREGEGIRCVLLTARSPPPMSRKSFEKLERLKNEVAKRKDNKRWTKVALAKRLDEHHLSYPGDAKKFKLVELLYEEMKASPQLIYRTREEKADLEQKRTSADFCASMTKSGKKRICTFANVESASTIEVEIEIDVADKTEDDQFVRSDITILRALHREFYNKYMDLVDEDDKIVMASLPRFRQPHWTGQQLMYLLTAFTMLNGRNYFMSATGWNDIERRNPPMPFRDWIDRVYKVVSVRKCEPAEPFTQSKNCRICYARSLDRQKTKSRCARCGPVCQRCEGKPHLDFVAQGGRPYFKKTQ
jgi:Transposase IS4